MELIKVNKKTNKSISLKFSFQRLLILMVAMMAAMTFTSCGDDETGGGNGKGKVWVDKKGGKTETVADLDAALLHIIRSGPGEYTVRIGEDQHITSNYNSFAQEDQIVTLKAESGTVEITRDSELLNHFSVQYEATLILDKGIILIGSGVQNTFDYGITVDGKGKLIMNNGAKITNFGGSSVILTREGIFEMNGGTICDNISFGVETDDELGGGVFTMNGGTISNNGFNSGSGTCGVFIGDGTFTMNDGTISGNADGGVGMYSGTFTMKKGRIIDNVIEYYGSIGGGVWFLSGTFIMDGGEISGNHATDGGGVFTGGIFTMNGGTIAKNTATEIGGGVFVAGEYANFTMNGGTIAGNTSGRFGGGGVGLYTDASFTKNANGIIYGSDGGTNANKSMNDFGHAAYVGNSPVFKRDLTAGQGAVIRWPSAQPFADGWDYE